MTIEKAQLQDVPKLLELYKDLYDYKCSLEEAEKRYESILEKEDYTMLVVKDGEHICGTALVMVCIGLADNFLVVEDVVVDGTVRGKGIGRMLFDRIDEIAEENQCFYSMLISSGFRKGAHAFYEKMGYVDDCRGFRKVYREM